VGESLLLTLHHGTAHCLIESLEGAKT
jgi:hypothetical protein